MSAEVVRMRGVPDDVAETLAAVDDELASTLSGLREVLARASAGERTDLDRGPLHVDLVTELEQRLGDPGKRIRPRLAHWGWVLAGGGPHSWDGLVRVGAALELLHLFGLVQDDVMDRSDTRRGRTTLHVDAARRHRAHEGLGDAALFGDSVAVLLGDLALAEAASLVAACSPAVRQAWRLMTVELVEGQLLDVTHTAARRRDLDTSRRIARFKSGRYTVTRPLQLGALVAGADDDQVERLRTWGDLVGDAFALRDDVLGVWGDPAVTGKPAGDDLLAGKPTVLLVWAADLLGEDHRELVEACDGGTLDAHGVARLQQAMERAGVLARAEDEIARLTRRAEELVPGLGADERGTDALREIVRSVAWRTS